MGQLLGLHRDIATSELSVFDFQMRRRLWWQILWIDGRGAQLAGSQTSRFYDAADFPLPGNFNDSDLSPEMKGEPEPHSGATEMAFCLLRYELGRFLVANERALNSPKVPVREKDRLIDEYENHIECTYLRYCDTAIPVHLLSSGGARSAMCKLRLMAHHPCHHTDRSKSMPQSEHDMLFATSLKMVEYDVIGRSARVLDGFSWHMDAFFQLDAFVFMLIESRCQPPGPQVDRAWELVPSVFEYHPEIIEDGSRELNTKICKLVIKAWEKRKLNLERIGFEEVVTPPIITRLRSRLTGTSTYEDDVGLLAQEADYDLTDASTAVQGMEATQADDASTLVAADWDFWDAFLRENVNGEDSMDYSI